MQLRMYESSSNLQQCNYVSVLKALNEMMACCFLFRCLFTSLNGCFVVKCTVAALFSHELMKCCASSYQPEKQVKMVHLLNSKFTKLWYK